MYDIINYVGLSYESEEIMFEIMDLHNHGLFGLDDGAKSYEMMCDIIKTSYNCGVRTICFTPHSQDLSGKVLDIGRTLEVFEMAKEYSKKEYPDLELYLGSELLYHYECVDAIARNEVLTMGGSRYVLVDFLITPDARSIRIGTERLLNSGYRPIIAHIERYSCFYGKLDLVRELIRSGAIIQINTMGLLEGALSRTRRWCLKLVSNGLVDIISSDAHNTESRNSDMSEVLALVRSKFGDSIAKRLFLDNGKKILNNENL